MKIKYLIKFTSKYEYAQDFMNGKLFMNQADFFHNIENGQGDVREAAFSNTSMAYIGANNPIYCIYIVYNSQIIDNKIAIDNRIIEDFNAKYAVIVDHDYFVERLSNKELKTNYTVSFGPVIYRVLNLEDSKEILLGKESALFYKHPYFSYQQEFRITVCQSLGYITRKIELDGKIVEAIDEYKNEIYYLKNNLNGIARIINIQDCNKLKDKIYIDLNLGR